MKQILFALLLIAFAPLVLTAQDSAVLVPTYFYSTRAGEIDPEMIHEPWLSMNNDRNSSWLAAKWKDATYFGPKLIWNECPGADSIAIYLRVEDTLSVQLYAGKSQSNTYSILNVRGPSDWQRHVVRLPKGYKVVGITLPPYDFANVADINELDARCYFGSCTAYTPSEALPNAGVAENHIGDANEMIYYDLLGRVTTPSRVMKRIGGNKFLVVQ